MKLKTVEIEGKTYAELQDGIPVYVKDDGTETALDAAGLQSTVTRLNGEAMGHRKAKETAEAALKAYEGLDADAARDALAKIEKLDQKQLIDAGEVDKVKAAITKTYDEKIATLAEKAEKADAALRKEMIGGNFARSKYITEKLAVPVPMIEATFGSNFTVEDGRVVAKDKAGNTIYGPSGDVATFDEAIETLVKASPFRDDIMKGRNQSGSGASGAGGASGGAKTISRAEFDQMSHTDRRKAMADGAKVAD